MNKNTFIEDYRRIYAIGDIHGNYNDFRTILALYVADGYNKDLDALVILGDMIDHFGVGESAGLVKHIRRLAQHKDVYVLRGNHEQLLIDAHKQSYYTDEFQIWWVQGGRNTFNSYVKFYDVDVQHPTELDTLMQDDINWFKTLPTYLEIDDYYFVHAGFLPNMSPEGTPEKDRLWIREPFLNSTYDWGKIVVHGHTSNHEPELKSNRINLDTSKSSRVTGIKLQPNKAPIFFDRYGSFKLREEEAPDGVRIYLDS